MLSTRTVDLCSKLALLAETFRSEASSSLASSFGKDWSGLVEAFSIYFLNEAAIDEVLPEPIRDAMPW